MSLGIKIHRRGVQAAQDVQVAPSADGAVDEVGHR